MGIKPPSVFDSGSVGVNPHSKSPIPSVLYRKFFSPKSNEREANAMRYPKNSYAAKEMRRRRIEARNRLKRKIFDAVSAFLLVVCTEVFFFAICLL